MKKLLSLLFIVTIISFCTIINVNATITWDDDYEVTITRSVTGVTNAVTNTFDYTITPDSNNPIGGDANIPTTDSIVMTDQAVSGTTATASTTVDFSGATFTKPGIYYYTITETGSTNPTKYPLDSDESYTVRITVVNTNAVTPNGTDFTATLHVLNNEEPQAKVEAATFTEATPQNQYGHIELTKIVTGNMADLNSYFRIGVRIYAAGTYTVSGVDSVSGQPAVINGNGSGYTYIKLKSGQTAIIGVQNNLDQIPVGTRIDFNEHSTDATGYSPSHKLNDGSKISGRTQTNYSMLTGTTTMLYTNDKSETVLTGVILTILPYIVLIAMVVGGIFIIMSIKKKAQILEKTE